jgi:putative transposase
LAHRQGGEGDPVRSLLHPWPVPMPQDWSNYINLVETEAELEALRRSVTRGQPFGSEAWQKKTAQQMGLEFTFRKQGRPRKHLKH